MSNRFVVRQSSAKSWRQCKQQYHYKYVEGLTKKKTKRPFVFGTIVHQMIEAYANDQDPFQVLDSIELEQGKYFAKEIEAYGDIINDLRYIMTEYFEHWGDNSLVYIKREGKKAEHKFSIEIFDGIDFEGKIDAVARAKRMRWLVEHKTFNRKPTDDDRWRNLQSCVYIRALEVEGLPVEGTVWDYIKSKPPVRPDILKNGEMSHKNIDSLPSVVLDVIKEHKLNKKLHTEFIALMKDNRSNYFSRVFTPVTQEITDNIYGDFLLTAQEMAEGHGKQKIKTIGLHCAYCDYQELCRTELTGGDVDFIKEHNYVTETDGDEETPEE